MADTIQNPGLPTPNPLLKNLDQFVGAWEFKGHLVGSDEETVKAKAVFEWLPGKFFLQQRITLDFNGMEIESLELIGYDEETKGLKSSVYSNLSPAALPYFWKVDGRKVQITVNYGVLDATFTGEFSEDGQSYAGGWRPNENADTTVNVAYDLRGTKLD